MSETRSASIASIGYDEARQRLSVTFAGGPTIVHVGVPSGLHAALVAAPHQAAFYTERIRDLYPRA